MLAKPKRPDHLRRNKVIFTCYLRPDQVESLHELNDTTQIPMSVLVRDGVDMIVALHTKKR